jgi:methionyl-tRNA synthetase
MNHSVDTVIFEIAPEKSTKWQNHTEMELVVCIDGEVEAFNGKTRKILRSGESVLFEAMEPHRLFNRGEQVAKLRTSWWNPDPIFKLNEQSTSKIEKDKGTQHLILPSFITPNGKMHIGHLAGPVVSSDILRRALAYSHQNVTYLSGSVGYQTHVDITAKKEQKTYEEIALQNSAQFIQTNELMGIGSGTFTTLTSSEDFHVLSQEIIQSFIEKGYTVERTQEVPCCEKHGFLFEAYVRGKCPHCDSILSSECETCGIYVGDHEIKQAICQACDSKVAYKELTRLYLPLEPWRPILEELIMQNAYTGKAMDFVSEILDRPLPEIPISILAENGIPIPQKKYADHVIFSAVELICRFALSFKQNTGKIANENLKDNYEITLFFGADNNYLRCIIFPILVHLLTKGKIKTRWFYSNEFYLLNGEKFSTSRKHILYANDLVKAGHQKDWLRLYLAKTWPENFETNFNTIEFENFCLKKSTQIQLISKRIYNFLKDHYNGIIPEGGTWDRNQTKFFETLSVWQKTIWSNYQVSNFSPNQAALQIEEGIDLLDDFTERFVKERPNKSLERTGIALACSGLNLLAEMSYPVLPDLAINLTNCLGNHQGKIEITEEEFGLKWFNGNTFKPF